MSSELFNALTNDEKRELESFVSTLKAGGKKEPPQTLLARVLGINKDDNNLHWYCERVPILVHDIATYCHFWLVASNQTELVSRWKNRLSKILDNCIDCSKGMEDALVASRLTYLSKYRREKVDEFMKRVADFNVARLSLCLNVLKGSDTLNKLPPAVSYHIFYNMEILAHSEIWNRIKSIFPSEPIDGWLVQAPPTLVPLLLSDEHQNWVESQICVTKLPKFDANDPPIQFLNYQQTYTTLLATLVHTSGAKVDIHPGSPLYEIFGNKTSASIWSRVPSLVRNCREVSLARMTAREQVSGDIPKFATLTGIVVSHLSRNDEVFRSVLIAFETMLEIYGAEAWSDQSAELPYIALDAIKENKWFSSLYQKSGPAAGMFKWIKPYLRSIMDLPTYSETLHRSFQIFVEEFQHDRFSDIRAIVLAYFLSALSSIFGLPIKGKRDHRKAILEVSNIHAAKILAVAFSRKFEGEEWKQARQQARKLVTRMLSRDIEQLNDLLHQLSTVEKTSDASSLRLRSSTAILWDRIRGSISPPDVDALAVLIHCTTQGSLLSVVPPGRFNFGEKSTAKAVVTQALNRVNSAISTIHNGFDMLILKFVDAMSDANLKTLCSREDIAPYLIPLFLSPAKPLSDGAQALVGQAYNVDNRADCFRALLENQCTITIESLIQYLQAFDRITKGYLEAVDAAKVLVRCYADILDVLCTRGTGLLFNSNFKKREPQFIKLLPTLWKHMCAAAGTIVQLTPSWALRYPSEEMVPWMRDALIFAEGLIDQRHVFESCILKPEDFDMRLSGSPSKPSANEENIIHDLGEILRPMAGWLRLTNPELLDRSYNLLLGLFQAFKATRLVPNETVLTTLEASLKKLSNKVSKGGGTTTGAATKLSLAQLGTLQKRLAELQGDEDTDIEFINQFSPQKPSRTFEMKKPPVPRLAPVFAPPEQRTKMQVPLKVTASTKLKPKDNVGKSRMSGSGDLVPFKVDQDMARLAIEERKAAKAAASLKASSAPSRGPESSSESDSGSESPSGLEQLGKLQKTTVKLPRYERKGAILLNGVSMNSDAAHNQNTSLLQRQDTARRGVRYIPDMTPLHRVILGWNYKHDGPEPPTSGGQLALKAVPDMFSSHRHYLDIFYPLIILECWNSLVKSKEEQLERVDCIINSKMHADLWVEIDITIEQSVEKGWTLSETDIVLLEHASGQQTLAKVHSARQAKQGFQATIRYSTENLTVDFDRAMTLQSSWAVARVYSLATIHREFSALMGLDSYDWADTVYRAQIEPPVEVDEIAVKKAMAMHQLNRPQARAILSALETNGFSLIQGPPGTGKTSTICGLIGAFLAKRRSAVTSIQAGKSAQPSVTRKALVCAPSNAAIDELAKRLREGVLRSDGVKVIPSVVRLGAESAINVSVKDISLDQLVTERLSKSSTSSAQAGTEVIGLRNELTRVKELRQTKQAELQASQGNTQRLLQIEQELRELTSKRIELSTKLTAATDKSKDAARAVDSAKRKARLDILNEADIICCTLSGAGHDIIEQFEFDLIVIDEAAQAIELSSLIPLKFSSKRCVMVGDPQQLPPTVISQTATKLGYNQSLFVRLQKMLPHRVHLLSIQYRMHPEISLLPSNLFYDGKLQDGPDMAQKTMQPWHKTSTLGVYKFFNVQGTEEQADQGHSQYNMAEVNAAIQLYDRLHQECPKVNFDFRIGIISMYRAQLLKLRQTFSSRYGKDALSRIDFNTVDGFQGQEKDIIILSCVRAGPNVTSIGFLSDARRINVAITRCRSSLYILGHAATLKRSDSLWRKIVDNADHRSILVSTGASISRFPAQSMDTSNTRAAEREASSLKRKEQTDVKMEIFNPAALKALNARQNAELVSNGSSAEPRAKEDHDTQIDYATSSSLNRKRALSSSDEVPRPAPASRPNLSEDNPGHPPKPQQDGPSSNLARTRPPPKPKTSNLFIPKKPAIKRALPPDAPFPNPKRQET